MINVGNTAPMPVGTGVFPAVTTKMSRNGAVDLATTQASVERLVRAGVDGVSVGKSWIACALAHKACRDDRAVLHYRVPRLLFDALALARGDGRHARLLKDAKWVALRSNERPSRLIRPAHRR